MTPELQKQILELPLSERWSLLRLLVDSLQPELLPEEQYRGLNNYSNWTPGFFERTAGAWQGEPLERGSQGQCDRRDWSWS
ncbi:hypothetical protein [Oscillatoria sp. FACHB-1406]|uniref:hypothetical protein n=1 Tax=Oscillatoria sp. FACHB-1406 TaxID=2692846 RepID=UPI00168A223B|nr:hypothetical protein [Oscillatoria sp. FACHB-1406]MBD2579163.1 hypothetical protein [Oscillatoria sp. FACHB-1406]